VNERGLRALGFLCAMLGFGLALDSAWGALAWLLMLAGAAVGGVGLWRARVALSSNEAAGDNELPSP